MAEPRPSSRVAVLIDSDNISASTVQTVMAESAVHGALTVKRAYGDWTSSYLKGWREQLAGHGIQAVQQFSQAAGKNATDSALIIDAMDLLYSGNVDAFCIVSSDSDYTRLAMRLRESGKRVYGLGYRNTVEAFRMACDRFTDLQVIADADGVSPADGSTASHVRLPDLKAIHAAVRSSAGDDGYAPLSTVGGYLVTNDPTFDSRNHGHAKLSQLVRALPSLEVEERTDDNGYLQLRVRLERPVGGAATQASGVARKATGPAQRKSASPPPKQPAGPTPHCAAPGRARLSPGRSPRRGDEPVLDRGHDGARAVPGAELVVDLRDVGLDGRLAEVEPAPDGSDGQAVGEQLEDLALARGEDRACRFVAARTQRPAEPFSVEVEWGVDGPPDGSDDVRGRRALEDEAGGARVERGDHDIVVVVHREDDDPDLVGAAPHLPDEIQAASVGK